MTTAMPHGRRHLARMLLARIARGMQARHQHLVATHLAKADQAPHLAAAERHMRKARRWRQRKERLRNTGEGGTP